MSTADKATDLAMKYADEVKRLRKLLGAVAWECDPNDCEWSDPASARAYLWGITHSFVQFREDD